MSTSTEITAPLRVKTSHGLPAWKDVPIPFVPILAAALVAGRKTETRRVLKVSPRVDKVRIETGKADQIYACYRDGSAVRRLRLPYRPGDRLWVREPWRTFVSLDGTPPRDLWSPGCGRGAGILYEGDGSGLAITKTGERIIGPRHEGRDAFGKLRPGRFMPRWASRTTLIVESVRIERLHDVTEESALAEGTCHFVEEQSPVGFGTLSPENRAAIVRGVYGSVVTGFRELWETVNGSRSWIANPWVATYRFRVIRKNIDTLTPGDLT